MPETPEILPPEDQSVIPMSNRQPPKWREARRVLLPLSAAGCLGFVLWGINQFLSLRGVVHVLASRIVLAVTVLAAIAATLCLTRFLGQRRNLWFGISVLTVVLLGFSLDWWAPKPREGLPPGQLVEGPPQKKPDTVTAVPATPKDPTKKKIRQAIGDLIQQGTRIRDRAPVYVGNAPPDITSEWKAWTAKTEGFLKGNFDSAEVQKFRSLDDPNQSLNSKLHYEIGYLEQLLDRIGL